MLGQAFHLGNCPFSVGHLAAKDIQINKNQFGFAVHCLFFFFSLMFAEKKQLKNMGEMDEESLQA